MRHVHGKAGTRIYNIWCHMKTRCYNPQNFAYRDYGGRGIVMSDEWRDSFPAFYRDMGDPPSKRHSIDRIDNDKGYSKDNCRWGTMKEQCRNRRSNCHHTINGRTMCLKDWAAEYGLPYKRVWMRMHLGWPVELALSLPKKVNQFDGIKSLAA